LSRTRLVDAVRTAEDAVVIQPNDSDVEEGEQLGDVQRPLLPKPMGEASLPASGTELEDEQRDGDAKTASLKASSRPAVSLSTDDRSSIQRRDSESRRAWVVVTPADGEVAAGEFDRWACSRLASRGWGVRAAVDSMPGVSPGALAVRPRQRRDKSRR
jgi:hypothetical protein